MYGRLSNHVDCRNYPPRPHDHYTPHAAADYAPGLSPSPTSSPAPCVECPHACRVGRRHSFALLPTPLVLFLLRLALGKPLPPAGGGLVVRASSEFGRAYAGGGGGLRPGRGQSVKHRSGQSAKRERFLSRWSYTRWNRRPGIRDWPVPHCSGTQMGAFPARE